VSSFNEFQPEDFLHPHLPCFLFLHSSSRLATSPPRLSCSRYLHLPHPAPPKGLTAATDIVLTGESAGGIGVWPNLDWLAARYPKARVIGAPIAGFYFFGEVHPRP